MSLAVSRRRLLAGAGAAVVGASCSGGNGAGGGDLDLAAEAAGIEELAADHYEATGTALTAGRLGALVPQSLAALVAAAAGHHQQAHNAWNAILGDAGRSPVDGPRAELFEALNGAAVRVNDVPGAAALALRVEDYAGQTYQKALPALQSPAAVRLAAQIVVAGHQRQAVLRYLLGREPFAPAGADPRLRLLTG
ncbi:MAG: ferritin-like domain-containing protein [Acidimicrobiales bacterium]